VIFGVVPLFFLELFISMKVGDIIGFMPSVLWIMLTMFLGITALRLSPYTFMGNLRSMQMGKIDVVTANRASLSYLVGAILLIVPGVVGDAVGTISLLYSFYLQMLAKIRPSQNINMKQNQGEDNVIDVEIID